jgi:hypothetical protein
METTTAAAEFTATVARYFHINGRTRRFRKGVDLHAEIAQAVELAATLPGYYSESTEAALRGAFAAVCGYQKHILGYRVAGETIAKVQGMTPYRFAQMLSDMIDQGVTNAYEAEQFFKAMECI